MYLQGVAGPTPAARHLAGAGLGDIASPVEEDVAMDKRYREVGLLRLR